MKTKAKTPSKKIPMRTCCGCRRSLPKNTLVRIVRTPGGAVVVDHTGKQNGRGTYICKSPDCLERAKKSGGIARALEMQVPPEIYETLKEGLEANEGG